jgi:hypothetical protein
MKFKKKQFCPFEEISIFSHDVILDTGRRWRTQIWKGTTQTPFQQSLVEIDSVVSEEKIFNGQNCSILSQKVPKFELYKHNDELFNIYYVISYKLWTFAYFDPKFIKNHVICVKKLIIMLIQFKFGHFLA